MDAFFLGSKEHEATHARLARIALISFSRRSSGNSICLTQCSLRGTTFANNTHVSRRAHKSTRRIARHMFVLLATRMRMITKCNRLLLFHGEINSRIRYSRA